VPTVAQADAFRCNVSSLPLPVDPTQLGDPLPSLPEHYTLSALLRSIRPLPAHLYFRFGFAFGAACGPFPVGIAVSFLTFPYRAWLSSRRLLAGGRWAYQTSPELIPRECHPTVLDITYPAFFATLH